jgi:hypothetical protein
MHSDWENRSAFVDQVIRYDDRNLRKILDLSLFLDCAYLSPADISFSVCEFYEAYLDFFPLATPPHTGNIDAVCLTFYTNKPIPFGVLHEIVRRYRCAVEIEYYDSEQDVSGSALFSFSRMSPGSVNVEARSDPCAYMSTNWEKMEAGQPVPARQQDRPNRMLIADDGILTGDAAAVLSLMGSGNISRESLLRNFGFHSEDFGEV